MIISKLKKSLKLISFIILSIFISSCAGKKEVIYFQNAKNFETIVDTDTFTPKFKVDDNVSIFVSTFDMDAVRPFNLSSSSSISSLANNSGNQSNRNSGVINYLIDIDGNIDYPVLGKIKLLGLTVEEAKELFKEKLSEYLKDPIINIRILNFRVTVDGEVARPGVYPVSGERVTILEALGMAGGLTIKGKRENVLIVRDFNGAKTYTRIDLTNKEVFNSPVYYLTQNDYIYVQPNNSGVSAASGDARLGLIMSVSSFVLGVVILITRR